MRIHHYLIFFNSFSSENECLACGDAFHGHRQHVTCRTPSGVMACVFEKKIGLTPSVDAFLATRTPTGNGFRDHPSESKTARGATPAGVPHGFECSCVCTRKASYPWIPLLFPKPRRGFFACKRKRPAGFSHEASSYVFGTTFNSASGAVRRFSEGWMWSVYVCSRREAHYRLNQVYVQSVACICASVSMI